MIIEYIHGARRAETKRDANGVTYTVFENGSVIWAKRVRFGQDVRHRVGGLAFIEASREQDRLLHGS